MDWIGQSNTWHASGNWDFGEVPGAADTVFVYYIQGYHEPHVTTASTIDTLYLSGSLTSGDWALQVLSSSLTVLTQTQVYDYGLMTVASGASYSTGSLSIDATSRIDNYGTVYLSGGTFTGKLENYGTLWLEGTITGDVEQDNFVLGGAQFHVSGNGSVGGLAVTGNLKLTDGAITFDFASASSFDSIGLTGNLDLTLDDIQLNATGGYKFASGATFTLIDVGGTLTFGNPYNVNVTGQHANFAYFVGTLAGSNDIVLRTFNNGATGGEAVLDATGAATALQYIFQSYDGDDSVYGGPFGPYWQRIVNITKIIGTSHNDLVSALDSDEAPSGPARNLTIDGAAGKDSLTGGMGDDTITGGAGNDSIVGGGGSDTVTFAGARSAYLIGYNGTTGLYTVIHKGGGSDGTDTVEEVETFKFNGVSYAASSISPPTNITGTLKIGEGKTGAVGTLVATDPTNTTGFTWSLSDNAGGRFAINASTGVVSVVSSKNWLLDYEQATSHSIVVRVVDAQGNFYDKTRAVSVTDIVKEDLTGSTAADKLYGGIDVDKFRGGDGNDTFRGGGGKDVLDGGAGSDTADYADKQKKVEVTLNGATNVTVKVNGVVEDTIKNIERVNGGLAGDKLTGDALANVLNGNGSNDTLIGGAGKDTLAGGIGNDSLDGGTSDDVLSGGAGKDTLRGGIGKDYFLFDAPLSASTNIDTIVDFSAADDTIRLDDAIFTQAGGPGTLTKTAFKANISGQATDSTDRIIYETDTGKVFYDEDGVDGVPRVQIAVLSGKPALTFADFVIV